MDTEQYRDIDGVLIRSYFGEEKIRMAMRYKPRPGEILIVCYPKCGTAWMQHIVCNILTRAKPPNEEGDFDLMTQFLDFTGGTCKEAVVRNGPTVSHLPPVGLRPVAHAKYIYVTRNPYDVAVSFYHALKGMTPKTTSDVSFERYITLFTSGKLLYGDFFNHLLAWYERRHDSNILLITYEDLKANLKEQVLKVADFLGEDHGSALRKDEKLLGKVLEACSFESMRGIARDPRDWMRKVVQSAVGPNSPPIAPPEMPEMHEGPGFFRKGLVGDWRNYFTPEQIEKMKAWIAQKTRGSNVMSLWTNCGLP